MKKIFTFIAMMLLCAGAMAQTLSLTFNCRMADGTWVQPDIIIVENITRGWTETLHYPDTQYNLTVWTGIENVETLHATSLQTTPNPFNGTTTVNLQMPEPGDVQVEVADVNGHVVETRSIEPAEELPHFQTTGFKRATFWAGLTGLRTFFLALPVRSRQR